MARIFSFTPGRDRGAGRLAGDVLRHQRRRRARLQHPGHRGQHDGHPGLGQPGLAHVQGPRDVSAGLQRVLRLGPPPDGREGGGDADGRHDLRCAEPARRTTRSRSRARAATCSCSPTSTPRPWCWASGALFGMLQGFSRASLIVMPAWFDYYRMLTAHGVLMALVFTTFFITGLFTYSHLPHHPAGALDSPGLGRATA